MNKENKNVMPDYKSVVKEYEKQINKFNKKYKEKYMITYYLDLGDDKGLDIQLHFIKENYLYKFKIIIDDLFKYEPEYVIFRLIEDCFIKGNNNEI